jgi:hypothetical protein
MLFVDNTLICGGHGDRGLLFSVPCPSVFSVKKNPSPCPFEGSEDIALIHERHEDHE